MRRIDVLHTYYSPLRLRLPWLGLMAAIAVGSSMAKAMPSGPRIPHFDKVAHFFIFGLLGTLVFRSLRLELRDMRRVWLAMVGIAVFGALDETLQSFNPNRTFDPYDWLADLSGALLAVALYRSWDFYRGILEYPLWGWLAKRAGDASNAVDEPSTGP